MNVNDPEISSLARQLRSAVPPCNCGLEGDLWPRMARRLEESRHPNLVFGWFEAVLAALVALACLVFPQLVPAMLYHL